MFPPEHWRGLFYVIDEPQTPLGNEEKPTAEVEPLIYQGVKQNFSARFAGGEPDASRPSCRSALNAHPTYGVRQASHEPFTGSALERLAGRGAPATTGRPTQLTQAAKLPLSCRPPTGVAHKTQWGVLTLASTTIVTCRAAPWRSNCKHIASAQATRPVPQHSPL